MISSPTRGSPHNQKIGLRATPFFIYEYYFLPLNFFLAVLF